MKIKTQVEKNHKYLLILSIIIFIFGFFLLRPYQLQQSGLMYSGDDESYFAHSSSIVFFQFPSYEKENWPDTGSYPPLSIGPGVMASPFVFIGSLIDRLEKSSISKERSADNIKDSWALFGFVLATLFYFYIGTIFLYSGLSYYFDEKTSFFTILFMIFFQYFPLYLFRRPVFSHIYEFALQSILIYILLRNYKTDFLEKAGKKIVIIIGFLAGMIFLVRYNNIIFTLIWPVVLFCIEEGKFNFKKNWPKLLISYSMSIVLIFIFKLIPSIYYGDLFGQKNYIGIFNSRLAEINNFIFYFKRIFHIFFWFDWGLIFTAPFIFIGLFYLFKIKSKLKIPMILLFLPSLLNIYIAIKWGTQGGWYGYRYIVFSLLPVLVLPFALFINNISKKLGYRKILIILFAVAVFPVLSLLAFEGNGTNLTLDYIKQYFGIIGWGNNTFQLEIWKTLFTDPIDFLISIFKGGPLYFIYLMAHFFNFENHLPAVIISKYSEFKTAVLIKTLIIYIFPFLMYFFTKKIIVKRISYNPLRDGDLKND
jgi:hypothetical protein